MEIRPVGEGGVGADSADRQTDTKKLKDAFRDYANGLKNAKKNVISFYSLVDNALKKGDK